MVFLLSFKWHHCWRMEKFRIFLFSFSGLLWWQWLPVNTILAMPCLIVLLPAVRSFTSLRLEMAKNSLSLPSLLVIYPSTLQLISIIICWSACLIHSFRWWLSSCSFLIWHCNTQLTLYNSRLVNDKCLIAAWLAHLLLENLSSSSSVAAVTLL